MKLEEKIIFLENYVEKLNLTIYNQEKKILNIEKTIQVLSKIIQDEFKKQTNDRPPHY